MTLPDAENLYEKMYCMASEGEIQPSLQNNALHHQDHSEPLWALYVTHLSEMEQLDLLSC